MNTYAKGYRNEKKAMKFFEDMGYLCWRAKITKFNNNDYFGLFDFIAIQKDKPTLWVQVKSNQVSKKIIEEIDDFAEKNFNVPVTDAIVMLCKDRKKPEVKYSFLTKKLLEISNERKRMETSGGVS